MQFSRFAPRPISSSSFRLFSPACLPQLFSPSFFHFLPQLFSLSPPAFFTLSPSFSPPAFFHFLPQLFSLSPPAFFTLSPSFFSLSPPAFFTFSPSFFHSLPQLFFTFSPSRPRFRGAPSIIWINYAHALESAIDNRPPSNIGRACVTTKKAKHKIITASER